MRRIEVKCDNATLTAPYWLENLWPSNFPSSKWPTFCGAGEGWGDKIIPDKIWGVNVSPACFLHDVGWATTKDSILSFFVENWYFANNVKALILASNLEWWKKYFAVIRTWGLYFVGVSTVGIFSFDPTSQDLENPLEDPVVKSRLKRLATAMLVAKL